MKIYLAHNYSAREYLLTLVPKLEEAGFEITSNWLSGKHKERDFESQRNYANEDCYDIAKADALVYFLEKHNKNNGTGKHFELGYAYALRKPVFVIGKKEDGFSVFHYLGDLNYFETIEEFINS